MAERILHGGAFPTMVTPYNKDGSVDYGAVVALTEWYHEKGCDGIFAVCQSSEIMFLSVKDRAKIAKTVKETAEKWAREKGKERITVVASGHVSCDREEQVAELCAVAEAEPDSLILISNRMDIENNGDAQWIADTQKLIAQLPTSIPLGIYECPKPYKRLLSEAMIKWCAESGRFYFIKDTCCDAALIRKRLAWCEGSNLKIFNANAQTMLETAKDGCFGYCGVMANFHPALYTRLLKRETLYLRDTALLQAFLGLAATVETLTYPCCAKYYLSQFESIPMETRARSADVSQFTDYQRGCIDQLAALSAAIAEGSIL